MDLDIMREMKFGEGTVWTIKYKCGWCEKPLHNQSESKYKISGNCCSLCNTKYAKMAFAENHEREITQAERAIRQTRLEMDILALELDKQITEEKRLEIVWAMERKHIKIKMLKGI